MMVVVSTPTRTILTAILLIAVVASPALAGPPYPLLGIYPEGALQVPAGINELNDINAWIAGTGKRVVIAGDFMDPEFPNPDFNVPADLGSTLGGVPRGAWVNGYIPFVNLLYFGPYNGVQATAQRTVTNIANGSADTKTREWAREFANWSNGGQKRAFLAPLPEANWSFGVPYHVAGPEGPEDFKRAFRRIRQIFEQELNALGVPLTAISWVFAPNNGNAPGHNFEAYYPGSDVVDIVGFSGYNQGGCAGSEPWFVWESYDIAMKPFLDRMRAMAPNKPIFLTQTGTVALPSHGVGDKDLWLDDTFTRLSLYPGLKGVIYFNQRVPIGDPNSCHDYRLRVPNTGQWLGFLTALSKPGVNYTNIANTNPDVANVLFARPPQIFADVVPNHPLLGTDGPPDLSPFIHKLFNTNITGGCASNPLRYCPTNAVTRGQMAKFLMVGIHGSGYSPPPATGTKFDDVPAFLPLADWIEAFAEAGITSGCGFRMFCPGTTVTRAQMAKFLLLAKNGSHYNPPPATGDFADVLLNNPLAAWIEALAASGITGGCGSAPPQYCPDNPVTRAQMAVFLVRTFGL